MADVQNDQNYHELEQQLGYSFKDRNLLLQSLTHKSSTNERGKGAVSDNERLEFLGDAVLAFVISSKLLERFPDSREGELSRIRALLVDEEALASLAQRLRLGEYLILGRGEEMTGGRGKKSLLADAFEALLAALYLDGGIQTAVSVVDRLIVPLMDQTGLKTGRKDCKTELQELAQSLRGTAPEYRLKGSSGPDHDRRFVVEVTIGTQVLGLGEGRSKKEAEQAAAREALERMT